MQLRKLTVIFYVHERGKNLFFPFSASMNTNKKFLVAKTPLCATFSLSVNRDRERERRRRLTKYNK